MNGMICEHGIFFPQRYGQCWYWKMMIKHGIYLGCCKVVPTSSQSWGYPQSSIELDGFSHRNHPYRAFLGYPHSQTPPIYIHTSMGLRNQLPAVFFWFSWVSVGCVLPPICRRIRFSHNMRGLWVPTWCRIFQGTQKEWSPATQKSFCCPILECCVPHTSFQAWINWRRTSGTLHLWKSHSWATGPASCCHGIHGMLAVQRERRLSHDFAKMSMTDRSWGIRNCATPCHEHSLHYCVNLTQPWDPWGPKCTSLCLVTWTYTVFYSRNGCRRLYQALRAPFTLRHMSWLFPGECVQKWKEVRIYIPIRDWCWGSSHAFWVPELWDWAMTCFC